MTDETAGAPSTSRSLSANRPHPPPSAKKRSSKRPKRPRRPIRPRLLDEDAVTIGLVWIALITVPFLLAWLGHPSLPSFESVGDFLGLTVWPLGLIAWGAYDWLRDLADYRDDLEQWRDDVASWEFERRLESAGARA